MPWMLKSALDEAIRTTLEDGVMTAKDKADQIYDSVISYLSERDELNEALRLEHNAGGSGGAK